MAPPVLPPALPFPGPSKVSDETTPEQDHVERASFFATDANNATGAKSDTGEKCSSVEKTATVAQAAPVANDAPAMLGEDSTSSSDSSTVAEFATGEEKTTVDQNAPAVFGVQNDPGKPKASNPATVAMSSTVADWPEGALSSNRANRVPRRRPIVRVTDGLTPGQYAVYSLMYEAGQSVSGSARVYKGGYADLGRLTGFSKRGLQNVIAELQSKHVIELHQHPGYHRTETSAYLVPDPAAVIARWISMGHRFAVGKSKALGP